MPTHALLIGIQNYTSPDAPTLRGCRNDVARFWRLCVDKLGMAPEHVQILAEPRIPIPMLIGGLSGTNRSGLTWSQAAERTPQGGATGTEITDALDALGGVLVADSEVTALLTYSGHGTIVTPPDGTDAAADLALCGSDMNRENLQGFVAFSAFRDAFVDAETGVHCEERVTVILDTCYSDAGLESTVVALPAESADPMYYRFLMAASHGEVARSITVDSRPYGAFSWAISSLMEQWQLQEVAGVHRLTVDHAELMVRCRILLDAIGLSQTPWIAGVRALDVIGLFDPNTNWALDGQAARDPNMSHPGRQLWAGDSVLRVYELAEAGHLLGTIGGTVSTEQWFLESTPMFKMLEGNIDTLTFDLVAATTPTPNEFLWDRDGQVWMSPPSPTLSFQPHWRTFVNADASVCLGFKYAKNGGTYTLTKLRWYTNNPLLSGNVFNPFEDEAGQRLTLTRLESGTSVDLPLGTRLVTFDVPPGLSFS